MVEEEGVRWSKVMKLIFVLLGVKGLEFEWGNIKDYIYSEMWKKVSTKKVSMIGQFLATLPKTKHLVMFLVNRLYIQDWRIYRVYRFIHVFFGRNSIMLGI